MKKGYKFLMLSMVFVLSLGVLSGCDKGDTAGNDSTKNNARVNNIMINGEVKMRQSKRILRLILN